MGQALYETGIYSVSDAAKLLSVPPQKVRGWVAGYSRTKGQPIIRNELERLGDKIAFSFTNLIEARFIKYFSDAGIHLNSLRVIAEEARDLLNSQHPFATKTIFKTDGKKVFAIAYDKTSDPKLYDLQRKNWALHEILKDAFIDGVSYDVEGQANTWTPRIHDAPNVELNPKVAFGQPTLKGLGVPTAALFDAFMSSDNETYESVGHWYDVPAALVEEAVRFEAKLAQTG